MNVRNSRPVRAPREIRIKKFQEWMRRQVSPATRSLLEQIVNVFADAREEDLESETDAVKPFSVFVKPIFACLTYAKQRWRDAQGSCRWMWIGLASFLVALWLAVSLRPLLHNETSLLFLSAVMVSAIAGGLRSGLLTTLLVAFPAAYILYYTAFMPAEQTAGLLKIGLFTLLALITCVLSDSLYLARQQAEAARQKAENLARRSQFLARASALLDSSHDSATLAMQVARAIVPAFAEGALVDLLDAGQTLRRVAAMHQNPEKEALLYDIQFRSPLDMQGHHPIVHALRTGQAAVIEHHEEAVLPTICAEPEYLELARQLEIRSLLCVPLIARNRAFGALTLIATSEERRYTPTDLVVAKDLALRMALALDNIRLYQEAQQEIREHERMAQQIREQNLLLEQQRLKSEEDNIRLSQQVSIDGLTGLNNHLAFQKRLIEEVQRATRYQSPLSLLLLDVDKFKQYNDTYGHPAGDKVLRQVAETLQTGARDTDFTARYGGEEFVVILPNADAAEAMKTAERLREAVEAMHGLERIVTASFGASTLCGLTASAPELIAWADKALYAAKHAGRNRVLHAETLFAGVTEAIVTEAVITEAVVSAHHFTTSERI